MKQALLIFYEADRSKEPIARSGAGTDIVSKLRRYHHLRVSNEYKRFAGAFADAVHGFRVLFITPTPERAAAILRTAQNEMVGDFVWVTDWPTLLRVGVHGNAWLSSNSTTRRSIFGSLASRFQILTSNDHDNKLQSSGSRGHGSSAA